MSVNEVVYEEVDPNFKHTLSVWWLLTWRAITLLVVIAFVFGMVLAVIVTAAGGDGSKVAEVVGQLFGVIGWLPITFFVTRTMFGKDYKGFRLVIVQRQAAPKPRIVTYYKEVAAE